MCFDCILHTLKKGGKTMREYDPAEMEIIRFEANDIITTSNDCENEGEDVEL